MSKYWRCHHRASELPASCLEDMLAILSLVLSEQTEVNKIDSVEMDAEILWFYISVDVALIMKCFQGSEHTLAYLREIQLLYWLLKIIHDTKFQIVHD